MGEAGSPAAAVTQPPADALTREIIAPAIVVVLGAIMTILDATIVNVALPTLGRDLHASIAAIQWVPTIYLLAFASVIPLSGWAADRFGAKTVWLASLGTPPLWPTPSASASLSPSGSAWSRWCPRSCCLAVPPTPLVPRDEHVRKESPMADSIQAFLDEWSAAEHAGDTERLEALLTHDFTAVGPFGFILPKQAWLARHRQGGLTYDSFSLAEIQTRAHDAAAIVTTRNNTRGNYQGHPIPEATRATLVLLRDAGSWRLAAIHMSFIAGTPGAPPIPSAGNRPEGHGGAA
ncbi:MAG TPA: MFS transporter [Streptosporangiaceae bacterium]|jgi:ketosteroid isomerase-like protein|nr:MFS transporter [Streptosporangiaceae bacterium]